MQDVNNDAETIAAVDEAEGLERVDMDSQGGEMVVNLVNLIGQVIAPLRGLAGRGIIDSEIMTAATVFAGTVYGELEATGAKNACGDEEIALMLTANFKAGREAGIAKVERHRAEREAAEATRQ